MDKKKGHPKAAPSNPDSHYADLSAEAQRKRLIDALRCGPVTTIEAPSRSGVTSTPYSSVPDAW